MAIRNKEKVQFERKNKTKKRKINKMSLTEVQSEMERLKEHKWSIYFKELRKHEKKSLTKLHAV